MNFSRSDLLRRHTKSIFAPAGGTQLDFALVAGEEPAAGSTVRATSLVRSRDVTGLFGSTSRTSSSCRHSWNKDDNKYLDLPVMVATAGHRAAKFVRASSTGNRHRRALVPALACVSLGKFIINDTQGRAAGPLATEQNTLP